MEKALRIGIPLTTLGWVALGIYMTLQMWDDAIELTGIGGVIMAWSFCTLLVLGLLLSPWAAKATSGKKTVVLLMMVPGLIMHIALVAKAPGEPIWLIIFLASSCFVWSGSAYRLIEKAESNKPGLITGVPGKESKMEEQEEKRWLHITFKKTAPQNIEFVVSEKFRGSADLAFSSAGIQRHATKNKGSESTSIN